MEEWNMTKGRIPTKKKLSAFEINRRELKEACGALDKKEEPKPFNPAFTENMKEMYGKVIEEKVESEVSKDLIKDMSVTVKDYVIGGDMHLDTSDGIDLFAKKGVPYVGADMINAKRLMYLTVLHGIEEGISFEEMCWVTYYPGRKLPRLEDITWLVTSFIKNGWIGSDDDILHLPYVDKDMLLYLTEKGRENVRMLVGMLDDKEKEALRIGAGKRVALILRERKAGRGYVPMPKVDNTKPAFDRTKDVLKLGEFLLNMGGGKDKETLKL